MTSAPVPVDISDLPDLMQLAWEVCRTGTPRLLQGDGNDLAVLMPAPTSPKHQRRTSGSGSSRRASTTPKGSVAARTAGALRYDGPILTIEEEKEAFQRGVAEQVMESIEG